METLETIKKTDTYLERKDYSLKNPDDKGHNEFTDLIDAFIGVALHMKTISDMNIKRTNRSLDFDSYVQIYGIDYEGNGTMQKPVEFVAWVDETKSSYSVYYGRFFRDIHKAIFEQKISYDEIVTTVEAFDLWWNT
jgi:hypothetical protein